MSNYEEVKNRAPQIMMTYKKAEGLMAAGRAEDALSAANEAFRQADQLIEDYPSTLAAYVVAGSAVQSAIQTADQYAETVGGDYDLPLVYANYMAIKFYDFLASNSDDANCANMLMAVANSNVITCNSYFNHVGEGSSSELDDRMTYLTKILDILYSVAENLRRVNPSSPALAPAMSMLKSFVDSGYEPTAINMSELDPAIWKAQEAYDRFIPKG